MEQNKISLFTAIFININVMVGAGIFLVPTLMAQEAGNLSFLGWPLIGIVFLPVVLSMAKISTYFPGQNSFYNYSKTGINKTFGFISGWLYFLGYSSIGALQTIGLREVIVNQFGITSIDDHKVIFNLVVAVIFCLLNFLTISKIGKIQNITTVIKLLPMIFIILLLVFYWNPSLRLNLSNLGDLKFTIPLALFGFWGFESSCNIADMIKGSKKNPYRATLTSFFIVVLTYTLLHLSAIHIMGAQGLSNHQIPAIADFLKINSTVLLNLLNTIISATVVTAYLGSIFGMYLSNSSNLHTLAKNNLLPFANKLKKTNKNERPVFAILTTVSIAFLFLTFIQDKIVLNSIGNFGVLSCFVLTFTSLLLIQLKKKEYRKTIVTILAFASCFMILAYSWQMIGNNNLVRLSYMLPLIILGIIGLIMFKVKEKSKI